MDIVTEDGSMLLPPVAGIVPDEAAVPTDRAAVDAVVDTVDTVDVGSDRERDGRAC
ncbi:hypothetical protein [Streptomyces sp. bgisy022]|uniref:hypothetical protein n=1 Tax=Streptomyces sp. bgisy022 TaxID=3413769 RepID=UPI003D72027C